MAPGSVNLGMSPPTSASSYRIISQASARIVKLDSGMTGRPDQPQTFLFFASQLRSRLAISAGLK
jgi:hypothetical protein